MKDFLTDEEMATFEGQGLPDFISDNEADKYFGNTSMVNLDNPPVSSPTKSQLADEKSASQYKPFFPANTQKDTPIQAGLKSAGNLPSSAFNLAKGIKDTVTQPVSTVKGILNAVKGLGEKAGREILERTSYADKVNQVPVSDSEQTFNNLGTVLKERFGSLENLQRTATNDPVGFGTDILGVLGGGAKLAGKTAQFDSAVSTVAKPVTAPATAVGNLAKNTAPKILSYTSDVPEQAIKNLLADRGNIAPRIGKADPITALKETRKAVVGLRKTLSQEWDEGIINVIDEFQDQRINISGKAEKLLDDVADEFGLDVPQNIKNVSVNETINLLKQINALPKAVLTFSPKGAKVRQLKDLIKTQAVENFGGKGGTLDQFYKNYSSKKSVFDAANDIVNAYAEGRPVKDTTAMNRLQNIFDENKPAYLNAILDLEKATGVDVMSEITASKFKQIAPNTLDRLSAGGGIATKKGLVDKLINIVAFPLTSPRMAGFIAQNLKTPEMLKDINNFRAPQGVKNYLQDPQLGMSIKDISKGKVNLHPEDVKAIESFVDYVYDKRSSPMNSKIFTDKEIFRLETDARRLAQKLGLEDVNISNTQLANRLIPVLDKIRAQQKAKGLTGRYGANNLTGVTK